MKVMEEFVTALNDASADMLPEMKTKILQCHSQYCDATVLIKGDTKAAVLDQSGNTKRLEG